MHTRKFSYHWKIVLRRRILVLVTVLTSMASAWLVSYRLPRVYEATCEFFVAEAAMPPSFFSREDPTGSLSRQLLLPTMMGGRTRAYLGLLQSSAIRERVAERVPEKNPQSLASHVDMVSRPTNLLRVRARDADPELAARTANAYAWALNEFFGETRAGRQRQTAEGMASQLVQTKAQLDEVDQELTGFFEGIGTADVGKEIQEVITHKAAMEADLERARIQLKSVESRIASSQEQRLSQSVMQYRVDRVALQAEIEAMTQAITKLTTRTTTLALYQRREESLRAKAARLLEMVNNLTRRYEEMEAQTLIRQNQVVEVRKALPPAEPKLPRPMTNLLVGAILGLLGGMYLALICEHLLSRVTAPQPGDHPYSR